MLIVMVGDHGHVTVPIPTDTTGRWLRPGLDHVALPDQPATEALVVAHPIGLNLHRLCRRVHEQRDVVALDRADLAGEALERVVGLDVRADPVERAGLAFSAMSQGAVGMTTPLASLALTTAGCCSLWWCRRARAGTRRGRRLLLCLGGDGQPRRRRTRRTGGTAGGRAGRRSGGESPADEEPPPSGGRGRTTRVYLGGIRRLPAPPVGGSLRHPLPFRRDLGPFDSRPAATAAVPFRARGVGGSGRARCHRP